MGWLKRALEKHCFSQVQEFISQPQMLDAGARYWPEVILCMKKMSLFMPCGAGGLLIDWVD